MEQAKLIDVAGPFPRDGRGTLLLSAGGKIFPVWCSSVDAESAHQLLTKNDPLSNYLAAAVMEAVGYGLTRAVLVEREGDICCYLEFVKKPLDHIRIPVEHPSQVVLLALAAGRQVFADFDINKLNDGSPAYHVLKSSFKSLWPIPPVVTTDSLMVLSDFLDASQELFSNARK